MAALRPYTPAEFRRIAGSLGEVYRNGELSILRILSQGNITEWKRAFFEQQLGEIRVILAHLDDAAVEWAGVHVPSVYEHNVLLTGQSLGIDAGMSALDQESIAIIQESLVSGLHYANQGVGRSVEDAYREATLQRLREGLTTGQTREQVGREIVSDLKERGIASFTDKGGREWALSDYAEMASRTAVMEASKQGTRNSMAQLGEDLVKVSTHRGPCELCEPWQGETLSLTGATEGYRTTDEAEAEGLMHPNCLHDYLPVASPEAADDE